MLFILHADHEQNASTSTVRLCGSSGTNPFAAIAADRQEATRRLAERLQAAGRGTDLDGFLADVRARGSAGRWPTWWRCWPASW